jgi:hypothetical protein
VALVVAALGAASVPALLALRDAYKPLELAVFQSKALVKTPADVALTSTSVKLGRLEHTFRSSARKLETPQVKAGRFVPFLGGNLRAATASANSAANLANAAQLLIDHVTVRSISFRHATLAEADLDRLGDGLRGVQAAIKSARINVDAGGRTDLLIPELRNGVVDLREQLDAVDRRVRVSLDGATAAKRLLGYDRPRRYFVAVQNNAESRATGGYIGNYGILVAKGGHVERACSMRRRTIRVATRASTFRAVGPTSTCRRTSRRWRRSWPTSTSSTAVRRSTVSSPSTR